MLGSQCHLHQLDNSKTVVIWNFGSSKMPSQQSDLWVLCADAPETLLNWKASRWDSNNFVIAEDCEVKESNGSKGVYKYNVIRDEWTLFVKYPKLYYSLSVESIAVDPDRDRLYISGPKYPLILCYTKAKRVRTELNNMRRRRGVISLYEPKNKQSMVSANGLVHSLNRSSFPDEEGKWTKVHSIWESERKINYVSDFEAFVNASHFYANKIKSGSDVQSCLTLYRITLVHVPSQNIILLIGDDRSREIWIYDIESKSWK